MKKISKKIVALVTMAMFVLTLVPFAAFAADASASNSWIAVDGETAVTDVDINDPVTVQFVINGEGANAGVAATTALKNVKVWVTDANNKLVDTATISGTNLVKCDKNNLIYKYQDKDGQVDIWNGDSFTVKFSVGGNYIIHAGVGDIADDGSFAGNFIDMGEGVSVQVNEADDTVVALDLWGDSTGTVSLTAKNTMAEFNLVDYIFWDQNGTARYTVNGVAYLKDGKTTAPAGTEITVISGDFKNLQFTTAPDQITVKTDNKGEFSFSFTMNDKRNLPIYLEVDGVRYALNIVTEETTAYNILVDKDGGYVMATTDVSNFNSVLDEDGEYALSDAVQFTLKTIDGEVLSGDEVLENEWAAIVDVNSQVTSALHKKNLTVEGPKKSTITSDDLVLAYENGVYTLKYIGDGSVNDLYPGTYTVRVALNSADYVQVTFVAAPYGTTQDLDLSLISYDYSTVGGEWTVTGRPVVLSDQVTLGQAIYVDAMYVDEKGLKIPAKNVAFAANGKAIIDSFGNRDWIEDNAADGDALFFTKLDIAANESLLGTTVTIMAQDLNSAASAEVSLTVVDSYNDFTLEFDPVVGEPNQWNDVDVTLVKEDGTRAQVTGKIIKVDVIDKSNDDAIVSVKGANTAVKGGKGTISLFSTEETTVDVRVTVKDSTNGGQYYGVLEYTVGDADLVAHHEVTMTIGSHDYVVDKQLFTMDAAPYVDDNWRTMVPLRALMEGFDADVEWDNDARTVTVSHNETVIVLTIGEETYTINGEEFTMDTVPVISGDRTYVPIRFVAEAMGFNVTPLYNAAGATAAVVFQS